MLYNIVLKNISSIISVKASKFDFETLGLCTFRDKDDYIVAMLPKDDIISISHYMKSLPLKEVIDYEKK